MITTIGSGRGHRNRLMIAVGSVFRRGGGGRPGSPRRRTPYTVDKAGDSVTVRIDLADARWWAFFQRQGLTKSYSTTLTPSARRRWRDRTR